MKRFQRWTAAVPLLALALVAAAPRTAGMADGWKFAWRISLDGAAAANAPAQPSMAVQLIPGKIRMDFVGGAPPSTKPGGYLIVDTEKGNMAIVSPADKQAITMTGTDMGAAMGAMGSFVKMDVSDVKVNVTDLGAGERMLSRATHKYRVTRSYAMTISVFGKKLKTAHESVTDAWLTQDFLTDRAFVAWGDRFARSASRLGGDATAKLMEMEKDVPKGVPLKQVVRATDTDDKGKATTTTTTMEMVELKKANLDVSLFEVPSDYQVTDMQQAVAETQKAMDQVRKDCEKEHGKGSANCDPSSLNVDSLVAAARQGAMEGLRDGVKAAAKEGAKDAVKRGILGRIKRPGG